MKRKIYFWADANANIGYGHFIRTLALADMLKDDFDCTFFTQTPTEYQIDEASKICKLRILPSDDSKFGIFLDLLQGDEIVVLDNYFFTTEYQRKIKDKGCKLVCIDDMHDRHYVADIVINHGINDQSLFSIEPYTQLCLGLEWALLRKPFLQPVNVRLKEPDHWLIAFGGSDPYNLTEKFIRLSYNNEDIKKISVVIGDAYQHLDSLKKYTKITVYKNLSAIKMADLMQHCEYAILPCSTICIEALSQKCKVFAGYYANNQKDIYSYFKEKEWVFPLDDLKQVTKIPYSLQKSFLELNIRNIFSLISLKYRLLFNGLFEPYLFLGLFFKDYTAIPIEEHRKIWKARNHEEIRKNMVSTAFISWKNHCNFISSLFNNKTKKYWAVYDNEVLIGSVNIIYIADDIVERGIFILPEYLNKSCGTKIEKATESLLKNLHIKEVRAKILHSNINSLYFHYKNHYIAIDSDDKYEYLTKTL